MNGIHEVSGSIPLGSTNKISNLEPASNFHSVPPGRFGRHKRQKSMHEARTASAAVSGSVSRSNTVFRNHADGLVDRRRAAGRARLMRSC